MAVVLAPFAASTSEYVSPPQSPVKLSSPRCKALRSSSSRFESGRTGKSSSPVPSWSGVRPAEILIRHEPTCLLCVQKSGRSGDHGGGAHDIGRRKERLDKAHTSRGAKLGGKQRVRRAGCGSESTPMGGRPVCLLPGVGGGLWEGGADSDGERFQSRKPSTPKSSPEVSVLLRLVASLEPLDVRPLSAEASVFAMDAMKRTISGMLGILPAEQFQVTVEMEREPLTRLLVSSMMTGYTLRNAEYRMCLQRTLEKPAGNREGRGGSRRGGCSEGEQVERGSEACMDNASRAGEGFGAEREGGQGDDGGRQEEEEEVESDDVVVPAFELPGGLGSLSPQARAYIHQLRGQAAAVSQELSECKRALAAAEIDELGGGEEQNDLLDYLRALEPEQVAELSRPTSSEVEVAMQSVLDNLVATLDPETESSKGGAGGGGSVQPVSPFSGAHWEGARDFGGTPLKFQAPITASRDYLARLLFWCMLLGHHMRALEYRLELTRTFNLTL